MSRRGLLVGVALLIAHAMPASATAATRYVANGGTDAAGCTSQSPPCATIQYAVDQADDGDVIDISIGLYTESVQTEKVLTFVGASAATLYDPTGSTRVMPAGNSPAFSLPKGGTLRSLRAEGGNGVGEIAGFGFSGGNAVASFGSASGLASIVLEDVVAIGGDGSSSGIISSGSPGSAILANGGFGPVAVSATDSELSGGSGPIPGPAVSVDGVAATVEIVGSRVGRQPVTAAGAGILVRSGASAEAVGTTIEALTGASVQDGSLSMRRSHVISRYGITLRPGFGGSTALEIADSLVEATNGPAAFLFGQAPTTADASLVATGTTFVSHGTDTGLLPGAVVIDRDAGTGAAIATMRNSIARHFPDPGKERLDLNADGGLIEAEHSSFGAVAESNGGSAPAPGAGGNVSADPLFVDPGASDYALRPASPLIDRGDPSIVVPGQLDLAGSPRSLDGDGDCLAAPDIGAFEVMGRECLTSNAPVDPAPEVQGFGMTNRVFAPEGKSRGRRNARRRASANRRVKRGTIFRYTLSEPARVTITIERRTRGRLVGRGGRARCVRARRGKAKPRCVRFVAAGAIGAVEGADKGSLPFSGRLRGKALRPGRYRATIVATDAAGGRSQPRRTAFRVVAG